MDYIPVFRIMKTPPYIFYPRNYLLYYFSIVLYPRIPQFRVILSQTPGVVREAKLNIFLASLLLSMAYISVSF